MYISTTTLSKGSTNHWELIKTKLTVFQPLITILASSALSFTAGQYLPCITTTISNSNVNTVAPLTIFIVFAVATLVLVAYLIKLSISKVSNKKEVSLSRGTFKEEQQTKKMIKKSLLEKRSIEESFNKTIKRQSSESQIKVDSDIDLKNKSSIYTSTQLSLAPDTAVSQTDTAGSPHSAATQFSLTSSLSEILSSKKVNGSNMPEAGIGNDTKQGSSKDILLEQIKKGVKLRHTKNTNVQQKQSGTTDQNQDMVLILNIALARRRIAIKSSDSESECSSFNSSSGWSTDEERPKKKRLTKHKEKYTPQALPSDNEKGNITPESGYRSGDDIKPELASLLHSTLKTDKPSVSPKPTNLQMRSKISLIKEKSNTDLVNSEVQDPSTLSFKERMSRFRN
ncbi:WAS family protein [Wolbachia endosymbiont of Onchocerca ochengi]|uniref:hypothetical protein n=1 Tax=Wolbachia endosymbiont of Onchocerca ochengi TaxID=100901 RepID=UPI00026DA93E|nr:hypothetical protein [Wolbachia endosymbiont of Onchocerca ochengi]CCF78060.1 WAS family protein [Wolbachia endosymbiont of Onchocerca ochengi]